MYVFHSHARCLFSHQMYMSPFPPEQGKAGMVPNRSQEAEDHFLDFYEEVFEELSGYGEIDEFHVCENLGDHLVSVVCVCLRCFCLLCMQSHCVRVCTRTRCHWCLWRHTHR